MEFKSKSPVLLPFLLGLVIQGCVSFVYMAIQDRFWDDAYEINGVKSPPNNKGIKDIKLVDQLVIGKATFEEALKILGDGYEYRLTFEPAYKRKYKGKFYQIRHFLHYWYREGGGDAWSVGNRINVALFFDTDHKLAFTYLKNRAYPSQKEYHNIPEDTPENQRRKFWPYADCDCKYYEKISNPLMEKVHDYLYDSYDCEWEEDYYKDKVKPKRREEKIFDWRDDK